MKYLLDTNTCIEILRNDEKVLSAFQAKLHEGVAISSIVLAELEYGVCNSSAYEKNRETLISFLSLVELLSFDGAAAIAYGGIRADLKRKSCLIGQLDMLIAAHAKANDLTIVTNNLRDFNRVEGLKSEDWTVSDA